MGWAGKGRLSLLIGVAASAVTVAASPAWAQTRNFDLPAQSATSGIPAFARQASVQILVAETAVRGKRTAPVHGALPVRSALSQLLAGTGLVVLSDNNSIITLGSSVQSPPVGAAQAAASVEQNTVGEVVVTAQKRAQRLLEVPAPVTALKTAALASQGQVRLQDFATEVPGLNVVTDQTGQSQINIRGISTGAVNSSTVAIYIDETPFGSSTSYAAGGDLTPDLDPASLERIEVLRGPQGTLYGASALGGLIKYVTIQPSLTATSGSLEADASAVSKGDGGGGVRGFLNTPIVQDKLGVTVSAFARRDPGYIDNPRLGESNVNGADVQGGRIALKWRPADPVTVTLSALLQHVDSHGSSQEEVDGDFHPILGDLKQAQYIDTPTVTRDQLYNLTVDYDLGWATAKSISSYQRIDSNFLNDDTALFGPLVPLFYPGASDVGIAVRNEVEERRFSEEFRLASPTGRRVEWQGGFFFAHETSSLLNPIELFDTATFGPLALPTLYNSSGDARYTEYAGFGDLSLNLTSRLNLLAGVRYDGDRQHFDQNSNGLLAGGPTVVTGDTSDHSVTYLFAPKFQITPDAMIYARVASGYRPGGVNSLVAADIAKGAPAAFKPDMLTNYEAGIKGAFFNRTLTLELSAFDIEWRQIQVIESVSGIGFIGNGAKARSSGIELAASWTPAPGLILAGNLAMTDAHLTEDAPGVGGVAGERLPFAPKVAANASADYSRPITSDLRGFVGATVSYQGDRDGYFGAPRPRLPAYTTVDLRAGIAAPVAEVTLYIRNVGDARGFVNATTETLANGPPYEASVIQPRTFGVSVSRRF